MNLICISCPRGCHLKVEKINDEVVVEGNLCPRGKTYAVNELLNPLRTITTTLPINSKNYSRIPVISSSPLPKDKMMDVMRYLKDVDVKAPIKINDVIVKNILGLNVNIVSSKTIKE